MRKTRQIAHLMVLLLVIIAITSCHLQSVSSQTLPITRVYASAASAALGQSVTVTINLANVNSLYGLEVILNWNPAVLQTTSIDVRLGVESFPDGVLHESSSSPKIFVAENNLTQTKGEYRLVATSISPAQPFSGSGNIVELSFKTISVGESTLDLQSQLFDYPPTNRDPRVSLPIAHTTQDSSITVGSTTVTSSPIISPTPQVSSELSPTPRLTEQPTSTSTLDSQPLILRLEIILPIIIFLASITILVLVYGIHRKKRSLN